MSHKIMTVSEVIEYLNRDDVDGDFAFRGDDYVPSENFNNSWYHGDDEPEYELSGVSCVNIPAYYDRYIIPAICRAREYGEIVYLLTGEQTNADEANHDPEECLMLDNKIVCVIDAQFERRGIEHWQIKKDTVTA